MAGSGKNTLWISLWTFLTKNTITKTISIIICVTVIFFAGYGTGHSVGKHKYSKASPEAVQVTTAPQNEVENKKTVTSIGYLNDLNKVNVEDMKALKEKALEEIQNWQKDYNGQFDLEYSNYKYEGAYLLNSKNDDSNIIYLIFGFNATLHGKTIKRYTWAQVENVEEMSDGSMSVPDNWGHCGNFAGFSTNYSDIVFGWESLKGVYYDDISEKRGDYNVKAYGNVYVI